MRDPKLSVAGAAALANGLGDALSNGYLRIYDDTGVVPGAADEGNGANVLLAELRLATPAAPATVTQALTLSAITADASANATGTPAYGRYYKSDGVTCLFQGRCGVADDSDFVLNDTTITAGGVVSCSAATLTVPLS